MQSQQKRVKWSRGETAEALEERTDTGITQASVEFMENCIPDIYGNISRRPGLKLLDGIKDNCYSFYCGSDDPKVQFIPFYITEDDFILFSVPTNQSTGIHFIRIKNGVAVAEEDILATNIHPFNGILKSGTWVSNPVSYSQQNNFMIIATESNIYKLTIAYGSGDNFVPKFEYFNFSAGWYAPYGTQTKQVTTTEVPGLSVNGHFYPYTYTYVNGDTNVFSWTDTGLDGQTNLELIAENIPVGSIIQFPENGAYLRVEGYVLDNNNVMVFGELLTPVADENATDNRLKVEYGYVLLQAPFNEGPARYPHPTKVAFYNQRLWAGDWKISAATGESYSLVIGSQIAKYTDFENNYNQENEAITLDILTQYREKIVHIGDYNGLKIMSDAYEYLYEGGAPIRQSANGSLAQCEPIIFEGLCLYTDSTGNQIKAMQYEFQSNLFNSSSINNFAPADLINNPITLASFEDKIYSTGKYLFVVNEDTDNSPKVVVCNFVPTNQATIWSRWSFPNIYSAPQSETPRWFNLVYDIVPTKKYPIFILKTNDFEEGGLLPEPEIETAYGLVPATLDFNARCDLESTINNENRVIIGYRQHYLPTQSDITLTLINTQVAVYSDGEFKFLTTTTDKGYITDDLTGLTNITVGIPINATVRSHPIDVGGKTKSIKKRIGKTVMSVHDTEAGAITINGKTGYMNPQGDKISFYGVTGMKDEIKYTLTNKNGAMFHLESLLMNIEYGTLIS